MKQMIVFVFLSSILCWFMFSPIYKHVLIVRQATLQKEVDLLLEVGANASHGYIDKVMMDQSKERLALAGFETSDLNYIVRTTNGQDGTDANHPIMRGEGIQLQISYPYANLLHIDQLIGMSQPSASSRIAAGGMKMSEYVH